MQYPAWARRRRRGAPDSASIDALARAMVSGDSGAARAALHRDIVLIIDGGGLVTGASTILDGRVAVASALTALVAPETSVTTASINGAPGIILTREGAVVGVLTAEMRSGMLSGVWAVCSPEKLRHWNR